MSILGYVSGYTGYGLDFDYHKVSLCCLVAHVLHVQNITLKMFPTNMVGYTTVLDYIQSSQVRQGENLSLHSEKGKFFPGVLFSLFPRKI